MWGNEVLVEWLVWWLKPLVLRGCRGWRRVLGIVTVVDGVIILVGVDFEFFFLNFCDGRRFLK